MTWFRYSQGGGIVRILDKQYVQLGTGLRLEVNQVSEFYIISLHLNRITEVTTELEHVHPTNASLVLTKIKRKKFIFIGESVVYPGHWYHIALVVSINSGYAKIFIDGRQDAVYNRTITFRRNSLPIKLGCSQSGSCIT